MLIILIDVGRNLDYVVCLDKTSQEVWDIQGYFEHKRTYTTKRKEHKQGSNPLIFFVCFVS